MEIRISHACLDIIISHDPNNEESINREPNNNPIEGKNTHLTHVISKPFIQKDKEVMDERLEYIEFLTERGLI